MTGVRLTLCLVLSLSFVMTSFSNSYGQNQGQTSSRRVNKQRAKPASLLKTKAESKPATTQNPAVFPLKQAANEKADAKPNPTVALRKTKPNVPASVSANVKKQQFTRAPGTVQMRPRNPMRRTELVQPIRLSQLPPVNPTQAGNSSRRVLQTRQSANPVQVTPFMAPPELPNQRGNRVASLQVPLSQQMQANPMRQNQIANSNGSIGLSMNEISGVKFADPKKFLKAGNFKFSNPDKFISEPPKKMVRKKSKPKKKSVKAVLASTKKNVLRIQDKQNPQTSPSDKIESLESKSVLDSDGSDVVEGKIVGNENQESAELDSKLESNLDLSSPTSVDDANYLTVSDVRAPISFNPFGQIMQEDEADLIKDTVPLFRPAVAGTTYSEISGLAFQPHFAGWTAHEYNHKPLYFEETNLERYGNQVKYQPWISGAHFFASALLIPYKMGQEPPGCCVTTLGHRRPGECVPYQIHRRPFSKKGFLMQALTVTALSL